LIERYRVSRDLSFDPFLNSDGVSDGVSPRHLHGHWYFPVAVGFSKYG